ncbi:histidine kinase [Undibacterium sp. Ji22W]|uniref:histidine kinase n=1 Tax=Undibacterium sp. Ji22W TaxID=3413038 RepID=UPI003BF3EA01
MPMLASFDHAKLITVPDTACSTRSLWRSIALVWLLWTALLFLATFANLYDLRNVGVPVNIQRQLSKFFVVLLPWPLLSTGLMLYFSTLRNGIRWQLALKIFAVLVLAFLPVHILYEHAFLAFRINKHAPSWDELMQILSPMQIWVDVMVLLFTLSAHVAVSYWQRSRQQLMIASQSRQDILALKLLQLRSHLEPYFLFSSLEGIENLLINAEGPTATRALARLSDLLRYVLESSQETEISIDSEIRFSKDYLSLQNLGFADRLQVEWALEERDWSAHQIPPLLLYPLFDYAVRNMQAQLQHASGHLRVQAGIVRNVLHLALDFSGDANQLPTVTDELQAAQQRIALLQGKDAAIRFVRYTASETFAHGITVDFPLSELSDA